MRTPLTPNGERERIDDVLDLQAVPADERWPRISAAIARLDEAQGRRWRLKLLLPDEPETARAMPALVAQWGQAGLRHDSVREPGGVQGTVLAPRAGRADAPGLRFDTDDRTLLRFPARRRAHRRVHDAPIAIAA